MERRLQSEADAARGLTRHELVELERPVAVLVDTHEPLVDAHVRLHRDRRDRREPPRPLELRQHVINVLSGPPRPQPAAPCCSCDVPPRPAHKAALAHTR